MMEEGKIAQRNTQGIKKYRRKNLEGMQAKGMNASIQEYQKAGKKIVRMLEVEPVTKQANSLQRKAGKEKKTST